MVVGLPPCAAHPSQTVRQLKAMDWRPRAGAGSHPGSAPHQGREPVTYPAPCPPTPSQRTRSRPGLCWCHAHQLTTHQRHRAPTPSRGLALVLSPADQCTRSPPRSRAPSHRTSSRPGTATVPAHWQHPALPGTVSAGRKAVQCGRGIGARGSPFRRPFPAMCKGGQQANTRPAMGTGKGKGKAEQLEQSRYV